MIFLNNYRVFLWYNLGLVDKVEELLKNGVDPNIKSDTGKYAEIHWSVEI